MITTSKNNNTCHFTLSENEKKCADFLVGYWLDYNDFFVVPVSDLAPAKSNNETLYKHVVTRLKKSNNDSQIYSDKSLQYLNNWESIINLIK